MSAKAATVPVDVRFGFVEKDPGILLHDAVSDFLTVADFVATHRNNPVADASALLDALRVSAIGIAENMRRRAELWAMDEQFLFRPDAVQGLVEAVEWGDFNDGIGSAYLIVKAPVVSHRDDAAIGEIAKRIRETGGPVAAWVRLAFREEVRT